MGGLLGGGGGQRVCWPTSQIIGGPGPSASPPLFLRLCYLIYIFITKHNRKQSVQLKQVAKLLAYHKETHVQQ